MLLLQSLHRLRSTSRRFDTSSRHTLEGRRVRGKREATPEMRKRHASGREKLQIAPRTVGREPLQPAIEYNMRISQLPASRS